MPFYIMRNLCLLCLSFLLCCCTDRENVCKVLDRVEVLIKVFIEGSVQTTCEATAKGLFPGGSIGGSVRVTVSGKVGYNVKVSYETSSASHEWKAVNCRKEQTNCPEFQKGKDIDRHVYRTSGCSNYESEIGSFWESI